MLFWTFSRGGALFLFLKPARAVLNDNNAELINVWKIVQKYPEKLLKRLEFFKQNYTKDKYQDYRKQYNETISSDSLNISQAIEQAALFILLNKTGFNGLYRVNSKGHFNVPPNQLNKFNFDAQNILKVNSFLKNQDINFFSNDFEKNLSKAQKGDVVYLDPPYDLLKENSFVSYTKDKFLKEGQERLSQVFQNLDKKWCKVILSNHKTPFIERLYQKYHIHKIKVSRMINCKGDQRMNFEEVIITNFPTSKLLSENEK